MRDRSSSYRMTWKKFIVVPLLMVGSGAWSDSCDQISSAGVTGFQEIVLSVSDLKRAVMTWRDVGEFDVHCFGQARPGVTAFWGLPEEAQLGFAILKKPNSNRGIVRLVQFRGLPQVQIRSSGMPWDTGGIFDLYMYVADVDAIFDKLRRRGWQAYNDPVNYVLGPFDIREAIMRGPDGESLVLMQRNAPDYDRQAFGVGQGFGWPFNAALITDDFEAEAKLFKEALQWKIHIEGESFTAAPGENPTGLPWNIAQTEPRVFAAFANHETDRAGSIQVMQVVGLTGKDFSQRARAPNLGLLAFRVPVPALAEFQRQFEARGGTVEQAPQTLQLAPYGEVEVLTVRTRNGSRLDFFTPLEGR